MEVKIIVQPTFEKEFKKLAKRYPSLKDDFIELIEQLQQTPSLGTDLGGGVHKIRMAITSKGKGKSGGSRIIDFVVTTPSDDTKVNLIAIYDKSERSTLKNSEITAYLKKNNLI